MEAINWFSEFYTIDTFQVLTKKIFGQKNLVWFVQIIAAKQRSKSILTRLCPDIIFHLFPGSNGNQSVPFSLLSGALPHSVLHPGMIIIYNVALPKIKMYRRLLFYFFKKTPPYLTFYLAPHCMPLLFRKGLFTTTTPNFATKTLPNNALTVPGVNF